MRQVDRDAIEQRGLPGRLLMENAGRAVAGAVRLLVSEARRPLVLCGAGNNGGDGFVIARVRRERDHRIQPTVLAIGDASRRSPEARDCFELLMSCGVEVVLADESKELAPLLERCDLVIDALFGVGLARPLAGQPAELVRALDATVAPVLAVDLPSGLSSDTGLVLGAAARADFVVTLGLPKLGLALRPLAAEIVVADIGLPAASLAAVDIHQHVWTQAAAARRLPARPAEGHKGTFGHVLIVGGSLGKTGAPILAARGALYSGAGLVTVATPRSLNAIFEAAVSEAMSLPYDDHGGACLVDDALPDLVREAGARDVLVVGPGLGGADTTARAVAGLLEQVALPAVVDADALNVFASRPEALRAAAPRVLTPHPGEMGRLLGRPNDEVQSDRVAAARELAERSGAIAVLKGARTVVAAPDGEVRINPTGGPGLASGGTGDVLAGVIGALLGQGLAPFDAAALGAWLHGRAGERQGDVGVAGEVAAALADSLAALREPARDDHGSDELLRFP